MRATLATRSFDDGADRWHFVDAAPAPALARVIRNYGWWSEETASFDTRRELAGTHGTLIVNLASDMDVVDASGTVVRVRAGDGFVAGLAQGTSRSRSTGAMAGIHVRASLATLARIAGTSIADLTDRVAPLDALPGLRNAHLGERLADAADEEARWGVLDACLAGRLADGGAPDPTLARITHGLAAGRRVATLADELGWSRKRLARTFRDAIGLEPRAYAGLARFERFAAQLQANPRAALADAAIAAGYADQAHLTREVRRYAAITPAALRRLLLPAGGGVRG